MSSLASTSFHGAMPGMRRGGEPVVSIAPDGALGLQSLTVLEGILGSCKAWASQRGDQTEAKLFAAPADLLNRLGNFSVVLADGVRTTVIYVESSDCLMSGPDASFFMATRGMPGLRQAASAFPPLPDSWAAAIVAAQGNGGRFLKPGVRRWTVAAQAEQPAQADQRNGLRPVAAAVSSPASSTPARAPYRLGPDSEVARRALVLDYDAEVARRQAIMAKYGISTAEQAAMVTAKINSGEPA
jgi:hypothetical protein